MEIHCVVMIAKPLSMHISRHYSIVALDRAYINYAKFEGLTDRDVVSPK